MEPQSKFFSTVFPVLFTQLHYIALEVISFSTNAQSLTQISGQHGYNEAQCREETQVLEVAVQLLERSRLTKSI